MRTRHLLSGAGVGLIVCLMAATPAAQGSFSAQIQAALQLFLQQSHTWTQTQTFQNIVVNGTCTGCGGGGISGTIAATQVAFGTGADEIGGSGDLTWDGDTLSLPNQQTVFDGTFTERTGTATVGTGWAEGPTGTWTHTPGNTASLVIATTGGVIAGVYYQVNYTITSTAGSVGVTFSDYVAPSDTGSNSRYMFGSDADSLTFTPTTDFDGTVSDVSIFEIPVVGTLAWHNTEVSPQGQTDATSAKIWFQAGTLNLTFDGPMMSAPSTPIQFFPDGIKVAGPSDVPEAFLGLGLLAFNHADAHVFMGPDTGLAFQLYSLTHDKVVYSIAAADEATTWDVPDFTITGTLHLTDLTSAGDVPACLTAAGTVYAGTNAAGVLSCP